MECHEVAIEAPRELVYQLMSSFGRGRLKGAGAESSRVLSRSGNDLVVEFRTQAGRFTVTTTEQVTLDPPERITFQHVKGPFHSAREEFVLSEAEGGMRLEHNGEFVWSRLPVLGWLVGRFILKRPFERLLEKHMEQLKAASEARASRSHVLRRTKAATQG
jgi:ribosome-associated toxin RatA of RatAB toxin-antitoxin module